MNKPSLNRIINIYESNLNEYISERFNPQMIHIIICKKGCAIFSFNQKKQAVSAGCMLLVSPDLITTVIKTSNEFSTICIDISYEVAQEASLSINPDLFTALYYNPIIKPDKTEFEYLNQWVQHLKWSSENINENKTEQFVKNEIQSFLLILESTYPFDKYTKVKGLTSKNKLYIDFCALICKMCHKEHGVQFYADQLCITPYYLSKITAMMAGISPKRMIDEQLIAETKHILLHTELTVNEIADKLSFNTTSHFCRFFRKYTDESPTDYRKVHN